jgi:hypothetical protein
MHRIPPIAWVALGVLAVLFVLSFMRCTNIAGGK